MIEPDRPPESYRVEIDAHMLDELNKRRPKADDKIDWTNIVVAIADLYHQLRKAKVPWRLTKDICLITWRTFLPR